MCIGCEERDGRRLWTGSRRSQCDRSSSGPEPNCRVLNEPRSPSVSSSFLWRHEQVSLLPFGLVNIRTRATFLKWIQMMFFFPSPREFGTWSSELKVKWHPRPVMSVLCHWRNYGNILYIRLSNDVTGVQMCSGNRSCLSDPTTGVLFPRDVIST